MMKVLFVDDEKAFLDTLTKRLDKRGVSADAAYSGQEALDFLEQTNKIEVVILDVKMPGMDGLETLRHIKDLYPLIEVIMLTGHATVDTAIEGMKRGAFDYMMKPCNLDELMAKMEAAAQKKLVHEEKIMEARHREIAGRRV